MIRNKIKFYLGMFIGLLVLGCGVDKPKSILLAEKSLPDVDFIYHIKPILSFRCFDCHGPDKNNQKAGHRLDITDLANAAMRSGKGRAIIKGSLKSSEVFNRIITVDLMTFVYIFKPFFVFL